MHARAAWLQHKLDTCGYTQKKHDEDLLRHHPGAGNPLRLIPVHLTGPKYGSSNLMFNTQFGATAAGEDTKVYLRPETAQGIFVNFNNVMNTARQQVPFGIAQIGKAFRNEVVARQFVFRMREFEQMEMQYFVAPGSDEEWYLRWKRRAHRLAQKASASGRKNLRFSITPAG